MDARKGVISTFLIVAIVLLCGFRQQPASSEDFKLRAVFLYNFSKYVKWKDVVSSDPIKVAIFSDNSAFYGEVKRLFDGKKSNNRPYVCKKITDLDTDSDFDILFVDQGVTNVKKALQIASANNALLITSEEKADYSMINFIKLEGNKQSFDIHSKNLKSASVEIDQTLIRLANQVIE